MAVVKAKKKTVGRKVAAMAGEHEYRAHAGLFAVPFIGNSQVVAQFRDAQMNGRLAHAYGFFGPVSVGKTRAALEVAAMLLGVQPATLETHPDMVIVHAGGEEQVSIERVREVVGKLGESPLVAGMRVAVVTDIDQLSVLCANTLLKTLEEPRGNTVIVVTSSYEDQLLPTLLSRVQRCAFGRVLDKEIAAGLQTLGDEDSVLVAVRAAGGAPGKAITFLQDSVVRERAQGNVAFWQEIEALSCAERFGRAEKIFGSEKAYVVLQRRTEELFDAAEVVLGVAETQINAQRTARIQLLVRGRTLLRENAAPRAVVDFVCSQW